MSVVAINDKKFGVLSDTHGSYPAWLSAIALFGAGVKTILHAGDVLYHGPRNAIPGGYTPADLAEGINDYHKSVGQVIIAQGNCDAAVDAMVLDPEIKHSVAAEWHGRKILMMHGDNFPLLRHLALKNNVALAISGHTHVPSITREEHTIFLNPGSTTIPKSEEGASAAIVSDEGIKIMTLDGREICFEEWQ